MKAEMPRHLYDIDEVKDEMRKYGLTPTPFPTLPVEIELGDGREMRIRSEMSYGYDDPGSERFVVWVH